MNPHARSTTAGYALALAGAIAFSGKAIVAKLLYRHGLDATAAVALRMLLAWPMFLAMALWPGRRAAPLARGDRARIVVLGITGYYLSNILDFAGLQYISASLERLILFVYPTIVALIAAARGHRGMSRTQALALVVSYAGVLFAFGAEALASLDAGAARVLWGSLLVLGSAVTYAVYLVMGGEMVARVGALRLTGLATSVACALCIAQFCVLRPWQDWLGFSPAVWELSLVNAVACTALPTVCVMRSMELIGPSHAAQVGMIGPVSTVLLAAWLLQERLTLPLVGGTVLVLAGVAVLATRGGRPVP